MMELTFQVRVHNCRVDEFLERQIITYCMKNAEKPFDSLPPKLKYHSYIQKIQNTVAKLISLQLLTSLELTSSPAKT
jgi:hypothetical protein